MADSSARLRRRPPSDPPCWNVYIAGAYVGQLVRCGDGLIRPDAWLNEWFDLPGAALVWARPAYALAAIQVREKETRRDGVE